MNNYKMNTGNIEKLTVKNKNFRKVIETGKNLQLVVMSLNPEEEIGMEKHKVDQFFRIEEGEVLVTVDNEEYILRNGDFIMIHAGSFHNVQNNSAKIKAKLYTVYSKPLHEKDCIQKKKKNKEC